MDVIKAVEKSGTQLFCEEIHQIDGSVDAFKVDEVTSTHSQITWCFISMPCVGGKSMCHGHRSACIIIRKRCPL